MTFGSGIRAQILEVIVRQALAGAPWKAICAGPMKVNSITEDEVEAEVDRRRQLLTDALSTEEKDALENYIKHLEKNAEISCDQTVAQIDEIHSLVSQLYDAFAIRPPKLVFAHSPATFTAYLNALRNRSNASIDWIQELCIDQDPQFTEAMEEQIGSLSEDSPGLGEPKNNFLVQYILNELQTQDRDFGQTANIQECNSALTDFETRGLVRSSFRVRLNPFLNRCASVFDAAITQMPESTFQFLESMQIQTWDGEPLTLGLRNQLCGIWRDSDLLAYDCMNTVLKRNWSVKYIDCKALNLLISLWRIAPWFSFFENYCFVGTNPRETVRDLRLRFSNENGAAITFADGYKVFAVADLITPRRYLENPQSLTISDIDREGNIEKRRGLLELYGNARYLTDAKAELIHKDEFGELYQVQIPDDEPLTMVKVINATIEPDGSYKTYFLRVPPHMTTAQEAVAWTFSISNADEYRPSAES
jgi:hypothetical protein